MRSSGVLMHISSLPGEYGIGKMGKEAYAFVDWLKLAGQHYWQILPLSPTSYGDSPYQSFSIFAGNPYFIDLETLEKDGLLKASEYKNIEWIRETEYVDYSIIYENLWGVLKIAYSRFKPDKDFDDFVKENKSWVENYGLFMALKEVNDGKAWYEWSWDLVKCRKFAVDDAKNRLSDEIGFYVFLQYEFYKQWNALKEYANKNGIEIIGDIPIYCALDSVDVWTEPELFDLDEDKQPVNVAGCPPDGYAPQGQLWGNPIYDWEAMKKQNFKWWINRIGFASKIYDVVRIDHFRGFDSFYSIPAKDETAENGVWEKGCGIELFRAVKKALGDVRIIAEDLGFITESVRELLADSGFPGMKMLEFGFAPDAKSEYLPCNFKSSNCVVYTSTHDSDTVLGWYQICADDVKEYICDYIGAKGEEDVSWKLIRCAWLSVADTAITQMQEILELDNMARMNVPSTCGLNWRWRMKKGANTEELAKKLLKITQLSGRVCE